MNIKYIIFDLIDLAVTVAGITLLMLFGFNKSLLSVMIGLLGVSLIRYSAVINYAFRRKIK